MAYTYDYPRPSVTVDVVLFSVQDNKLKVLLIQRGNEPYLGHWALPGGFVDMDEELEAAARRELQEETGLEVGKLVEFGTFGTLGRDPRGRTVAVAYLALHLGQPLTAHAGDDAAKVGWFSAKRPPKLAFDHADILRAARQRMAELAQDPARLRKALLAKGVKAEQLEVLVSVLHSLNMRNGWLN